MVQETLWDLEFMFDAGHAPNSFTDSEGFWTVVGVLIGIIGGYGVQWLRDKRHDDRVRTVSREALAEEITSILRMLDDFETTFIRGLAETGRTWRWPSGRLSNTMLGQCLNPAIGSLLSPGEQAKVAITYYQIMPEARADA